MDKTLLASIQSKRRKPLAPAAAAPQKLVKADAAGAAVEAQQEQRGAAAEAAAGSLQLQGERGTRNCNCFRAATVTLAFTATDYS